MCSSLYDSKTYSFIDKNTVSFTESQVKNEENLQKFDKNFTFSHQLPFGSSQGRSSGQEAQRKSFTADFSGLRARLKTVAVVDYSKHPAIVWLQNSHLFPFR